MLNHVRTAITPSSSFQAIKARVVTTGDGREWFDFEQLIPMPGDLIKGLRSPKQMEASKGYNWYDWSIENWGTKRNAYRYRDNGRTFRFETAWSHPEPVMMALSRLFPEVTLTVAYADEELGKNVGSYTIQSGIVVGHDRITDRTEEARRLAKEVWELGTEEKI